MGYCICIVGSLQEEEEETYYLSYNWNCYSEVCVKHLQSGEECDSGCERTHLWSFREDCHGKSGSEVERRVAKALELLASLNIFPREPSPNWSISENWFYEANESKVEKIRPIPGRNEEFAHCLTKLCDYAVKFPNHFFIGDIV